MYSKMKNMIIMDNKEQKLPLEVCKETTSNQESSDSSSDQITEFVTEFDESSLPPIDGGYQAWLFLVACFMVEGIVWGMFASCGRY